MEELSLSFIGSAFLAGLLTFLAPCTFPLIPAYLTMIAGETVEEDNGKTPLNKRVKLFINGVFYVLGFSLVFVSLGLFAGYLGSTIPGFREWFRVIGGIVVIIFGFYMVGILRLKSFDQTKRLSFSKYIKPGEPFSAFLLGFSVAFGWTPCVGPLLGSILTLATNTSTALEGGVLLVVFSLGLGVPFLLFALAAGAAISYVKVISKYTLTIQKVGGVLLVIIGLMLLFDKFYLFVQYGFQIFEVIGYDRLLQYL